MSAEREPIVVRVDEINALVDAVPYLLGFNPTESIVAVSLHGPRERMEFTLRLDLIPEEYDDQVAHMFVERMRAADADSVMVFVFTDDEPSERGMPRRELVDRLVKDMPMGVREAWLVTDKRIWSYLCDDERCCPPEGQLREETSASLSLSAAHALNGDVVLPDRESVVATVQPVTGEHAEAMERAIDQAAVAHAALDPQRARTKARRLAAKLRARYESPPATITDDEAATLIVALHDWQVRDKLLGAASGRSDAMLMLLHDLAVRAVPPLDAPACAAYAWAAYMRGNGLVASIAVERALKSDPGYSLAQMIEEALSRQVPPSRLRRASIF